MSISYQNLRSYYTINEATSCWEWTKLSCTSAGYGQVLFLNKMRYAHRVSYYLHHPGNDLDSVYQVMHSCDNRKCINPSHLSLGTNQDNVHDMLRKGRAKGRFTGVTSCVNGHEFTTDNTYIKPNGYKACRTCKRNRDTVARPWRYPNIALESIGIVR